MVTTKEALSRLSAGLRQLLFPREFRIAPPAWPDEWLAALSRLADGPPPAPTEPEERERARFLADLATSVWRLRQKMIEPGTDRPKEQFRREFRHLQSVWDVLTQAGMEIQDHTRMLFDSGQALKVLAFQPTPGVTRERVQDTLKPTIYFKGKHIQMGEVIVECPEKSAPGGDSDPPPEAPASGSAARALEPERHPPPGGHADPGARPPGEREQDSPGAGKPADLTNKQ